VHARKNGENVLRHGEKSTRRTSAAKKKIPLITDVVAPDKIRDAAQQLPALEQMRRKNSMPGTKPKEEGEKILVRKFRDLSRQIRRSVR
jgi:hypothetical protein